MKKNAIIRTLLSGLLAGSLLIGGCSFGAHTKSVGEVLTPPDSAMSEVNDGHGVTVPDDKYRTCYEIFVYSFYDSDGDGIGDLNGVKEKLDYINDGADGKGDDLECNEIWLMPVSPSTTYHKYDVTDYEDIDPEYGTMDDFDALIGACHDRGVRVILDFVMNHTSSEHPWFTGAAEYLRSLSADEEPDADACPYVDYYHFSKEKQNGYAALADSDYYYEAQFWEGMPDLNWDNPVLKEEFSDIVSFWLEHGADGFRLDATTQYYTGDDTKNIEVLRWFNETVKEKNPNAYIVGEAWASSATYGKYYQSGVDSFFNFTFAGPEGTYTMAARGKLKGTAYDDAVLSLQELIHGENSDAINASFLSNHDMGRVTGFFANDDGSRTKLAGALNLLSSGNAFVYYGEELGMKGSGKDENKRAPMFWSKTSSAEGMCNGPKDMDRVSMGFPAADEQIGDAGSIFEYYRQAIRIRNSYPAIARGAVSSADGLADDAVSALLHDGGGEYEDVLILTNLSEEDQALDLSGSQSAEGLRTLGGMLIVGDDPVTLDGDTLTLPALSVAVLTAK